MSKLNIAFVTPYFYPAVGGIESCALELAKKLKDFGHEVDVYTSKSNFNKFNTLPDYSQEHGINIYRFREYFNIFSTWYPRITKTYDLWHFHNFNIHPHTALINKNFGKQKMIATLHGGFSRYESKFPFTFKPYGLAKFLWQDTMAVKTLNKLNKIICLNGWEQDNVQKKGVLPFKISVIPNGIEDFAMRHYEPVVMDKPYVLSLSRISKVKRIDIAIRAIKEIPDIYLVVAGGDVGEGEVDKLKALTEELNIKERVRFVGIVKGEEKYSYLAGAKALVVCSEWEMHSVSIIEALAQGIPVIASDRFGNPYTIENGKTGVLTEYENVEELTEKLKKVLSDSRFAQELGKNAKNAVHEKYTWDKVARNYERVYYEVLDDK